MLNNIKHNEDILRVSLGVGLGGAFLQTSATSMLKQLAVTMDISSVDRDVLTAFLTQGNGDEADYAPQSGQITG